MTFADQLTLARIVLAPVVVLLFALDYAYAGTAVFCAAMATDWLDGRVARRSGRTSPFGSLLDPVADKVLVLAALVMLIGEGVAPAWMVAVIIGRELAVTGLRSLAASRGRAFPASPLGKLKMVSQVTAILLLILGMNGTQPFFTLGKIALWVVVAAALVSAADYYRTFAAPAPSTPAATQENRHRHVS